MIQYCILCRSMLCMPRLSFVLVCTVAHGMSTRAINNGSNAFIEPDLRIKHSQEGLLSGLTFAAKDLFDVSVRVYVPCRLSFPSGAGRGAPTTSCNHADRRIRNWLRSADLEGHALRCSTHFTSCPGVLCLLLTCLYIFGKSVSKDIHQH